MKLFITTLGRINNQITWDRMPLALKERTIFVVSEKEAPKHKKRGRRILICPYQGQNNLTKVRDWLLKYCLSKGYKSVLMMDDDIRFQIKKLDGKIVDCSEKEYIKGFKWISKALKRYAHAGFAPRNFAWNFDGKYMEDTRILQFLGYNLGVLKKHKLKFKEGMNTPTVSDINMALQLLKLGYANILSTKWRISSSKNNAPGGCSLYRNEEMNNQAAKDLCRLYPEFVKLRAKERKGRLKDKGQAIHYIIQWKKALKSSGKRILLKGSP